MIIHSYQEQNEETTENSPKIKTTFKCDQCVFKCGNKVTLNKHDNKKHKDLSNKETVSTFIFRLGLQDFLEEDKKYFSRYGFNLEDY